MLTAFGLVDGDGNAIIDPAAFTRRTATSRRWST